MSVRLLIAIPCLDGKIHADTVVCLSGLTKPDFAILQVAQGSIITIARNKLVRSALDYGFTHVLFLDSDMTFPKNTWERLNAHNKPIVGAYGVRKQFPISRCGVPLDKWSVSGLCEMESLGTAVMLINCSVFRKIEFPWFAWEYAPNNDDVSEDVYFCRKARAAGLKIWCDTSLSREIGHIGRHVYKDDSRPPS